MAAGGGYISADHGSVSEITRGTRSMVLTSFLVAAILILPSSAFCGAAETGSVAVADSGPHRWGLLDELLSIPTHEKPSLQQSKSSKKKSSTTKKKSSKKKKKKPAITVAGTANFQTIYDDNILRFSDGFVEDFRRNDPADKFHTETYDDVILSPRLFINFTGYPLGKRKTRLYLGVITWQYGRNPIKDNDLWLLRLRQYTATSNHLEFSYSYSPPSYVKHLSDREPFIELRSTTPLQWRPFMGVRHGLGLTYTRRLHKKLTGSVSGGRVLRFYNRPFLENDNREWNGFTTLSWTPFKRWRLYGKYMYADADARGLDTTTETIATSDDGDGSYERDLYEVKIRYRPKGGVWFMKEFEIKGQRMDYYFTGTKPAYEDPLHTGRKDDVNVFESYITTKKLFGPMSFKWGYRFAQRVSSLPGTFEGEDAEDKDYTNNRTWIEARYSF